MCRVKLICRSSKLYIDVIKNSHNSLVKNIGVTFYSCRVNSSLYQLTTLLSEDVLSGYRRDTIVRTFGTNQETRPDNRTPSGPALYDDDTDLVYKREQKIFLPTYRERPQGHISHIKPN